MGMRPPGAVTVSGMAMKPPLAGRVQRGHDARAIPVRLHGWARHGTRDGRRPPAWGIPGLGVESPGAAVPG